MGENKGSFVSYSKKHRDIVNNEKMEFNEITNAETELVEAFILENAEKRYLASQTIANKNEEESMTVMISYN